MVQPIVGIFIACFIRHLRPQIRSCNATTTYSQPTWQRAGLKTPEGAPRAILLGCSLHIIGKVSEEVEAGP